MRRGGFSCVAATALLLLGWGQALAQDATVEGRLREALRRTTVDLRALQDNQAAMQTSLDQARQQNEQLARQLEAAKAAATPAAPDPQVAALQAALPALEEQNKALRSDVGKLQGAYQQTAEIARAKDLEGQRVAQLLRAAETRFGLCEAENAKLIGVANDILHLYRTPEFRATILGSHEPLIGFKQVELQNTVQDYEDRILAHRYLNAEPAAAASPGRARR